MKISQEQTLKRKNSIPDITYNQDLPIIEKKEHIQRLLKQHQVLIIAGETGSGKTTQIPKICLESNRGIFGMIGHTQPRKIAARAVANRIAEELNVELGTEVGYQVRFNDRTSKDTLIKIMTDGILLNEIQYDRNLNKYDTLIIDEAHERSLNIDFILGYLKNILIYRKDLKVIITSATIDCERFSEHFNNAPIVQVEGRTFPVDTIYLPDTEPPQDSKNKNKNKNKDKDELLYTQVIESINKIESLEKQGSYSRLGDILIFLSGERDIRELAKKLRLEKLKHTSVLPLYARLSSDEQQKIFKPSKTGRRIILATNVAETSLTVPGIQYIIDPGFARISRYNVNSRVQRLPIEAISKASANQRKGRSGRVSKGLCIRLYSEDDFNSRSEFTDPEVSRTGLASVILQMLALKLGDIEKFPFLDMPENRSIKDGYNLLMELGAITDAKKITHLGKKMSQLPIDPKFAKMLLEANKQQAFHEVLIIVSALSIQDPRERRSEFRQNADTKHKQFQHETSDFMTFVNLWNWFEEHREELTQNKLKLLCKEHFIHYLRMREWKEMHRQLLFICNRLGYVQNEQSANYDAIHRSILSALITHVGTKDDKADYQGIRNRKFWVAPNSSVYTKRAKWCMAAQFIETSKVYAHVNAKIEPEWIEPLASSLVKNITAEPYWSKKRGEVLARQQVLLYGLIIAKRTVNYSNINSIKSREIFIRSALVEQDFVTSFSFFAKNRQMIIDIEKMEDKVRRRNILIDDDDIFEFYNQRIPDNVYSRITLEKWLKTDKSLLTKLTFELKDLQQSDATNIDNRDYPTVMNIDGVTLPLTYVFDPNNKNDGVTVTIPVQLLNIFPEYLAEWLTPGLLLDKIINLMRLLPKTVRKNFIPIPQFAQAIANDLTPCNEQLISHLSEKLFRMTGFKVDKELWDSNKLEKHLQMNFRIVTETGAVLGEDRNIQKLKHCFTKQAEQSFTKTEDSTWNKKNLTSWSFDKLPKSVKINKGQYTVTAYPGLIDNKDSVNLTLFDNPQKAEYYTKFGITKLLIISLKQPINNTIKGMINIDKIAMLGLKTISKAELKNTIDYAIINCILSTDDSINPFDKTSFENLLSKISDIQIKNVTTKLEKLLLEIFTLFHNITKQFKNKLSLQLAFAMSDIKCQLENLIYKDFLKEVPWEWLQEYPRYMKAIQIRIEKLTFQTRNDQLFTQKIQQRWQLLQNKKLNSVNYDLYNNSIELYRWMLEEYRVSVFAQALKTKISVSDKKLDKLWEEL